MLNGSLDAWDLPELFRLLARSEKTGRLDVVRRAGRGHVYFRDGAIYFASSNLARTPLGRKLVDAGALTESQLMEALDEHAVTGERVGDILVRSGVVTRHSLEAALRAQIADAIFELMRWDRGEFSWQPGVSVATEITLDLRVEDLIVEASRRLAKLAKAGGTIPSTDAIVAMADGPSGSSAPISITPEEWRLLVLVNGRRTVAEVVEEAGFEQQGALDALHALAGAGLIEVVSEGRGLARPSGPLLLPEVQEPGINAEGVIDDPEFFLRPAEATSEPLPDVSPEVPPEVNEWFTDPDTSVEAFDEPAPGELVGHEPASEDEARPELGAHALPDDLGRPPEESEDSGAHQPRDHGDPVDAELVSKLIDGLESL